MHRRDFMTEAQKRAIPQGTKRTHAAMLQYTKVARPGKTAKDRALKQK